MNLLLDVDDTLYDQLTPFTEAYQSVFGPLHYEHKVEDVFARNRWYSDEVFEQVRSGQMLEADMHVYRITRAMEDMGIHISVEQARAFQNSYADYYPSTDAGAAGFCSSVRDPAGHYHQRTGRAPGEQSSPAAHEPLGR